MKAWMLEEPKKFKQVEMEMPEYKDKVVIKVKAIGICGSELSAYKGIFPIGTYPRTLGHEIAGEVMYAPENDKSISIGDKVVLDPYLYCGECYPCSQGKTNCCENIQVISAHCNGAHMEYFAHDINWVHKVPAHLDWKEMAMIEALSISVHGVRRARVQAGEFCVITGAGAIGLFAAQYVNAIGAKAILVDPVDNRLEVGEKLGIEYTVNPVTEDAPAKIKEITKGRMPEAMVECAGAVPAVKSSFDYLANTGRLSLVGYPNDEVPVPTFLITKKEIDIVGSRNSAQEFPICIDLIATGKVRTDEIISHVIDFDKIPEYFEKLIASPSDYIKVVAELK